MIEYRMGPVLGAIALIGGLGLFSLPELLIFGLVAILAIILTAALTAAASGPCWPLWREGPLERRRRVGKPNYEPEYLRWIHEQEIEAGFPQSDYRKYGVDFIDAHARMADENDAVISDLQGELDRLAEARRRESMTDEERELEYLEQDLEKLLQRTIASYAVPLPAPPKCTEWD